MSLTKSERETILRFSDDAEEGLTLYTHNKTLKAKMLRMGAKVKTVSRANKEEVSWTLTMPREWFRAPRKLSEARKALGKARAELFRKNVDTQAPTDAERAS